MPPAVLRHPLGNVDPLEAGAGFGFLHLHDPPLGDHRAGELVVAHQDRRAGRVAAGGFDRRVEGHARQHHEAALEDAAVGEFDPIRRRPWSRRAGGQQQGRDEEEAGQGAWTSLEHRSSVARLGVS